ncbi:hypothetical protein SAMN05660826_01920 [Caldanaerovirga acetigignens]|uniref:DUF8052 domain-containing protein n=1 Tax=Caldanaerovirga acetigignens TaxID=447595 RepID=A0A1M7LH38_9FIRM|nr:hypothetical protein [Caldanaerovirga acetigignens]SHM77492.1 hypothetical protein SAMN05660826_01920 [Caldanaerovirga acetigignens]
MEAQGYLELLWDRLRAHFDIEREKVVSGYAMDIFAKCHIKHLWTFLTPYDVIDSYEINEYFVVKVFEQLSLEEIVFFDSLLKQKVMKDYVRAKDGHKCSTINGVIIATNGISDEIEKYVRSYSYEKSYLFSLRGWCRINLAAVDLKNGNVILSKKGRNLEKLLKLQL